MGIVLCLVCAAGCVTRRMLIRSDPPGAMVYVDEYPVGVTPVAHHFTYYGTRKIRLVKDGYETLTVMQPIRAPWYEFPPLDFVSENLWPGKLRDRRVLQYRLTPQMVVPTEQLLSRAEALRRGGVSAGEQGFPGVAPRPAPASSVPPDAWRAPGRGT